MITVKLPHSHAGPTLEDGSPNPLFTLVQQALILERTVPGCTVSRTSDYLQVTGVPEGEISLPAFFTLAAVPNVVIEGYPAYAEVPAGSLDWDICQKVPNVLPIDEWVGEGEDRENVGKTRLYREMPGYTERDGRYFIALSYPISGVAQSSGSQFFSAADILAVEADIEGAGGKIVLASAIPAAAEPEV